MCSAERLLIPGIIAVIFCSPPSSAEAAILINEIAWMGDKDSASNEWIELRNTSDVSVDLTGWTLTNEGSIDINLSGTIGAGAYAVLERTDDDSAPGSAFMIYGGALANTGTTLTLYRDNDAQEDRVAGGNNWENVGGDNTTKETAQLSSAGWITAAGTPGEQNATAESEESTTKTSSKSSKSQEVKKGTVTERTPLTLPDTELHLEIVSPVVGFVNQPLTFTASSSGIGKTLLNSLSHSWNFGDLSQSTKRNPTHSYLFPGEYMVYLEAEYARHSAKTMQSIVVLPIKISLARDSKGNLQIHNNTKYPINIGGFQLTGLRTQTLPANTHIQANGTLTITADSTPGKMVLKDQAGETVAIEGESRTIGDKEAVVPARSEVVRRTAVVSKETIRPPTTSSDAFTFASNQSDLPAREVASTTTPSSSAEEVVTQPPEEDRKSWLLLALLLLSVVGYILWREAEN